MGSDYTRRVIVASVVSLAIIIGYGLFMAPKAPPPGTVPAAPAEVEKAPAQQAQAPAAAPPAGAPIAAAPADAPEETVTLDGPEFRAVLTSHGGAVKSVVLESEKFRRDEAGKTVAIDLVRIAPGQPWPLALARSPELGGPQDPAADPLARAPMQIVSKDEKSVAFEGSIGNGRVRKVYRLTGKPYELGLEVEVSGLQGPGSFGIVLAATKTPDSKSGGMLSGPPVGQVKPICRLADATERFDVGGKEALERFGSPVQWGGVDEPYFIAAVLPAQPAAACTFSKGPVEGSGAATLWFPVEGGGAKQSFTIYAGPEDLDTLRAYGRNLDTAIDYGGVANFFSFFARILLYVLRWFETLARNWGVAIILLTIAVKVILYPLTAKSMQSMNEMRKLQPEIEKLRAKHGADRERLNLETMKLYQAHKVNPLGGCLPMLLQLPIWFALYATLQTSVELYREPFLWVSDLTLKDPFYVLPLLMGVTMFVQQKISPQPADNAQAKMMLYFLPIFFTFLMLQIAAGLTLYIFVNNVLSIAQQQWMMRRMASPPAATPAKG